MDNGIYASGVACGRTWNLLGVYCGQVPQVNDSLPVTSGVSRGLRQTLYTDRRIYRPNQSVQIMLYKTNITNDPVSLVSYTHLDVYKRQGKEGRRADEELQGRA